MTVQRPALAERIAARPFKSRRRLFARFVARGRLSVNDVREAEAVASLRAARANLRKTLCGGDK